MLRGGIAISIQYYLPSCSICFNTAGLTFQQSISTIAIPLPTLSPSQFAALESWLQSLLWENILLPPLPSLAAALEHTSLNDGSGSISSTAEPVEDKEPFSIHRTKGLIHCEDGTAKMLQGVREVFDITDLDNDGGGGSDNQSERKGKIVLIGRGLRKEDMEASLARALREVGD